MHNRKPRASEHPASNRRFELNQESGLGVGRFASPARQQPGPAQKLPGESRLKFFTFLLTKPAFLCRDNRTYIRVIQMTG